MLTAALIPFLAFGLFALTAEFLPSPADDDDMDPADPVDPVDPADPADPMDPADPVDPSTLGATFTGDSTGVDITFGENETGRLAVVTYSDTEDTGDPNTFQEVHEARYYLVPATVAWPDNTSETQGEIPGAAADEVAAGTYDLAAFEDRLGLELLGVVDLLADGNATPTSRDMAAALPPLTTNATPEYLYIEANTDGDELITFLQEGWIETRNGVAQTPVTEATTGTDDVEWFVSDTTGIQIDAAGGDDFVDVTAADASVAGGAGEDNLTVAGSGLLNGGEDDDSLLATEMTGAVTMFGGAGDDVLDNRSAEGAAGVFIAQGDVGNDILSTNSASGSSLYGGLGNDILSSVRVTPGTTTVELYGDEGDDTLNIDNDTSGFGGEGADLLQVAAGGTGDGGAGDDTLQVLDFFGEEDGRAVISGGTGVDVFDIVVRNPFGTATDNIFAEITDFDPNTEVLQVSSFGDPNAINRISITEDPNGAFTDVEVFFNPVNSTQDAVSTIIRLTGATGVTTAQVSLA